MESAFLSHPSELMKIDNNNGVMISNAGHGSAYVSGKADRLIGRPHATEFPRSRSAIVSISIREILDQLRVCVTLRSTSDVASSNGFPGR